jgi:hypothetical protein
VRADRRVKARREGRWLLAGWLPGGCGVSAILPLPVGCFVGTATARCLSSAVHSALCATASCLFDCLSCAVRSAQCATASSRLFCWNSGCLLEQPLFVGTATVCWNSHCQLVVCLFELCSAVLSAQCATASCLFVDLSSAQCSVHSAPLPDV